MLHPWQAAEKLFTLTGQKRSGNVLSHALSGQRVTRTAAKDSSRDEKNRRILSVGDEACPTMSLLERDSRPWSCGQRPHGRRGQGRALGGDKLARHLSELTVPRQAHFPPQRPFQTSLERGSLNVMFWFPFQRNCHVFTESPEVQGCPPRDSLV